MGISTTSQPRAKRKLDRAQPQEEGRHRSCAAPYGASAECQSKTTGSRPWLKLYRRYAAKMANLQSRALARVSHLLRRRIAVTGLSARQGQPNGEGRSGILLGLKGYLAPVFFHNLPGDDEAHPRAGAGGFRRE